MQYYFMDCFTKGETVLRKLRTSNPYPDLPVRFFNRGNILKLDLTKIGYFSLMPIPKGIMPEFFRLPTLVMDPDFADALQNCGIDNLQLCLVRIKDEETGEEWEYIIGNIIGVLDVIDKDASEISPGSPLKTAILFRNIVIDEQRCRELPLFRPLHKRSSIIVSENIKKTIQDSGEFPNVSFVLPENYL